ncbi:hypothetical protein OG961_01105 [Streptomyces sp. NBC_00626]
MSLEVTADQHDLLTLCALRIDGAALDWSLLARSAQSPVGLAALLEGQLRESSKAATENQPLRPHLTCPARASKPSTPGP